MHSFILLPIKLMSMKQGLEKLSKTVLVCFCEDMVFHSNEMY